MPFNLTTFKKSLKSAFSQLEKSQAEALSIEIAANYTAGQTAGAKHKSIKSAEPKEDEGLTTEEKAEIAALTALSLGYLSGFNKIAQAQIIDKAQGIIQAGGSEQEVKQYVDDIFEGKETITIDNTGKKKKEIYVDKDLKLSEVTKTITKAFSASVITYATLLGDNAAHSAYEAGRKAYLIKQGHEMWIFVGPVDEKARPWHVALIGTSYTYGSQQSNYAERCLNEPHCRHRAEVFYGDSRDTKQEVWDKLKKDNGLFWDENEKRWNLK